MAVLHNNANLVVQHRTLKEGKNTTNITKDTHHEYYNQIVIFMYLA